MIRGFFVKWQQKIKNNIKLIVKVIHSTKTNESLHFEWTKWVKKYSFVVSVKGTSLCLMFG